MESLTSRRLYREGGRFKDAKDLLIHVKDAPVVAYERRRAVCAIVPRDSLKYLDARWYPEVIGTQPNMALARCRGTGLLLDAKCVVTADDVAAASDELALVFDFYLSGSEAPTSFGDDQVRVDLQLEPNGGLDLLSFREPLNDRPLVADKAYFVEEKDIVFALGHPAGRLMQYWGDDPVVCSSRECTAFVTTLRFPPDASGSPVFIAHGGNEGNAVGVHHQGYDNRSPFTAECVCEAKVDQSWEMRLSSLNR